MDDRNTPPSPVVGTELEFTINQRTGADGSFSGSTSFSGFTNSVGEVQATFITSNVADIAEILVNQK